MQVLDDLEAPTRTGGEGTRRFIVRYAPSLNQTDGRIELVPNG
jgi:hypothetical protein